MKLINLRNKIAFWMIRFVAKYIVYVDGRDNDNNSWWLSGRGYVSPNVLIAFTARYISPSQPMIVWKEQDRFKRQN
jgi:hypothetical protein